ncbi:AAA family ATPase [soil metagenome]
MIIWVNGTFGAGKTTTGTLLAQRDPRLRVFDPEWVGYLLANNLADHQVSDFQHYESWRRLVPVVADEVVRFTGQSLVAIQAVLDEGYWSELTSGLTALGHQVLHVVMESDPVVMTQRIDADEVEKGARRWRIDHLATYAGARRWMTDSADLVVDSTDLTPEQATDRVWAVVAERLHTQPG